MLTICEVLRHSLESSKHSINHLCKAKVKIKNTSGILPHFNCLNAEFHFQFLFKLKIPYKVISILKLKMTN